MECEHTDPRAYCKRSDGCRDCEAEGLAQTGGGGRMECFWKWAAKENLSVEEANFAELVWQAATSAETARVKAAIHRGADQFYDHEETDFTIDEVLCSILAEVGKG